MKGTGRKKEAPEWTLYGYMPSMARKRGRFDRVVDEMVYYALSDRSRIMC